ncbi:MAG: GNAT family N-acetyltransferase [Anaerolineae bacterium]|nr:GNAT family N-acetyltransferase [Anaerolineae bacterium]
MEIHDTAVTDRKRDFDQIWSLLTETHRPIGEDLLPMVNYWSSCRFESWIVFSAPGDPSALDRKLHLWRTRDGDLVGLAIVEGLGRDFHVISHPGFVWMEPDIVAWVEQHWPADGKNWVTYAEADDRLRQAALVKLGYRVDALSETMHAYDLERLTLIPELPQGFSFSAASDDGDLMGRSRLVSMVFHPERDPESTPPPATHEKRSYDAALDLVVRGPDRAPVAFAAGFVNATSGIAEVEPVGTHPAYRRRGFALAVVTEVFSRLRDRGVRWVHIASEPEPAVSNRLYHALGPVGQQHFVRWRREMHA